MINTLQFMGFIDESGSKITDATKHFLAADTDFASGMEKAVRKAYPDLFDTHGEDGWTLARPELVTFFRMSDGTSEIVGGRQASTFEILAAVSGKREASYSTKPSPNNGGAVATKKHSKRNPQQNAKETGLPPKTCSTCYESPERPRSGRGDS